VLKAPRSGKKSTFFVLDLNPFLFPLFLFGDRKPPEPLLTPEGAAALGILSLTPAKVRRVISANKRSKQSL